MTLSRISKWQDDLPYALKRLDDKHLFVLTTRAHLLNLARRKLDIAGYEKRFPDLGEVVVNASRLTRLDKARMLYRHCKTAGLAEDIRDLIKGEAESIVDNQHFTPERIRRLVQDVLRPNIASTRPKEELKQDIETVLRDPGKAMSVSFAALPEPHKWMLFSLLEADFAPYRQLHIQEVQSLGDLGKRFERICPPDDRLPADQVSAELSEAFVRRPNRKYGQAELDWIHPSVRDLAIEELSRLPKYRRSFLRFCGTEGLRLACSVGGGGRGQVSFPLLVDDEDWTLFADRVALVVAKSPEFIGVLSGTLETASTLEGLDAHVKRLEQVLYEIAVPGYLSARGPVQAWTTDMIVEFVEAFTNGRQHPAFGEIALHWHEKAEQQLEDVTGTASVIDEVEYTIDVSKAGTALLRRCDNDKDRVGPLVQRLIDKTAATLVEEYEYLNRREEPMDLDNEIYEVNNFVDHLKSVVSTKEIDASRALDSMRTLVDLMEGLNKLPTKLVQQSSMIGQSDDVSIEVLFADL